MKILKPGKVEQRKFVCPKCGGEFVADKSDAIIARENDGGYIGPGVPIIRCPMCTNEGIKWYDGTPYPQQEDDAKRLTVLIREWNWWSRGTCGFAQYLLDNGVTFREG